MRTGRLGWRCCSCAGCCGSRASTSSPTRHASTRSAHPTAAFSLPTLESSGRGTFLRKRGCSVHLTRCLAGSAILCSGAEPNRALTVLGLCAAQVESRLKGTFGATLVLRDTPRLPTVLEEEILPAWSGIYRPRLALDAVGGASGKHKRRIDQSQSRPLSERTDQSQADFGDWRWRWPCAKLVADGAVLCGVSGERLSRTLSEGCPLVSYGCTDANRAPQLRPMLLLAG